MGKGNGHQGDYHLSRRGDACKQRETAGRRPHRAPTRLMRPTWPRSRLRCNPHNQIHFPRYHPHVFPFPTPGGYIYFSGRLRTFVFAFKLAA
jgi:hypothetical protein